MTSGSYDSSEDDLRRQEIEIERQQKDQYFKHAHESPIPNEDRNSFSGLKYYEVDLKYRFKVSLQKYPSPETVAMITSTGDQRDYLRYGYFEFRIDAKSHRLQVYKPAHTHGREESLFIPFRDKTSGVESYGASRYIDIPENEAGVYQLDFNRAYNPYCAYSENYVCPFAPRENWLDAEIKAGEKIYKPH